MNCSILARRAAIAAACLGASAAVGVTPALATTVPGANIYGSGSSLQKAAQLGGAGAGLPNAYTGLGATWTAQAVTSQATLSGGPFTSTYTPTQSGAGLAEFGNAADTADCVGSVTGVLDNTCDSNATVKGLMLDSYIATDDPPTGTAGGDLNEAQIASGSEEATVPIYQAPVSLALSLPTGVTLGKSAEVKLTTADVEAIYDGSVPANAGYPANSWGALLTQADGGSATDTPITAITSGTPTLNEFLDTGTSAGTCQDSEDGGYTCLNVEVRNGSSGTTYSLQGFLYETGDANYPLANVGDGENWPGGLTYDDGTAAHPNPFTGLADPNGANAKGSTLVKNTEEIPGSIGYANEADAVLDVATTSNPVANSFYYQINPSATSKWTSVSTYNGSASHQIIEAEVQNNEGSSPAKFAEPGAVSYVTPTADTVAANVYDGASINDTGTYSLGQTKVGDWAFVAGTYGSSFGGTIASDPVVNGHGGAAVDYPIIASTYDVGWKQYDTTTLQGSGNYNSLANASAIGATAKSYLVWLAGSHGQASVAASKIGIQKVPTAIDTQGKAQAALVDSIS